MIEVLENKNLYYSHYVSFFMWIDQTIWYNHDLKRFVLMAKESDSSNLIGFCVFKERANFFMIEGKNDKSAYMLAFFIFKTKKNIYESVIYRKLKEIDDNGIFWFQPKNSNKLSLRLNEFNGLFFCWCPKTIERTLDIKNRTPKPSSSSFFYEIKENRVHAREFKVKLLSDCMFTSKNWFYFKIKGSFCSKIRRKAVKGFRIISHKFLECRSKVTRTGNCFFPLRLCVKGRRRFRAGCTILRLVEVSLERAPGCILE